MGWFSRGKAASAQADGTCLQLHAGASGPVTVDVDWLDRVSFLQVGDDMTIVYEGWWLLFPSAGGCVAVSVDCPGADALLRDGPLTPCLERVQIKETLFAATRPSLLRRAAKDEGVAVFDASDTAALIADTVAEPVTSVREFPIIG
jgi:hypothetical protein